MMNVKFTKTDQLKYLPEIWAQKSALLQQAMQRQLFERMPKYIGYRFGNSAIGTNPN